LSFRLHSHLGFAQQTKELSSSEYDRMVYRWEKENAQFHYITGFKRKINLEIHYAYQLEEKLENVEIQILAKPFDDQSSPWLLLAKDEPTSRTMSFKSNLVVPEYHMRTMQTFVKITGQKKSWLGLVKENVEVLFPFEINPYYSLKMMGYQAGWQVSFMPVPYGGEKIKFIKSNFMRYKNEVVGIWPFTNAALIRTGLQSVVVVEEDKDCADCVNVRICEARYFKATAGDCRTLGSGKLKLKVTQSVSNLTNEGHKTVTYETEFVGKIRWQEGSPKTCAQWADCRDFDYSSETAAEFYHSKTLPSTNDETNFSIKVNPLDLVFHFDNNEPAMTWTKKAL
jgi:hypothetical protein